MIRYVLLILMFTLSNSMRAQYYELGFGGGGSIFHGDVGAVALNAEGILNTSQSANRHNNYKTPV